MDSSLEADGDPEVVARLPDIESLDESSDFTAFMAEGVPEALRRRALRRLWRLNPVFANLDGLNDYDEDFTDAATVIAGMKTLYKVGRGLLDDRPEANPEADPEAEEAAEISPRIDAQDTSGEPAREAPPDETEAPPIAEAAIAARPAPETAAPETAAPETAAREAREPEAVRPRGSGRSAVRRRWGDPDA